MGNILKSACLLAGLVVLGVIVSPLRLNSLPCCRFVPTVWVAAVWFSPSPSSFRRGGGW